MKLESRDDTLELMSIQHEISLSLVGDSELEESVRRFMEVCLRRLSLRSVHLYLLIDGIESEFRQMHSEFQGAQYLSLPRRCVEPPHETHSVKQALLQWNSGDFSGSEPLELEERSRFYYLFPLSGGGALVFERISKPLPRDVVEAVLPSVEHLQASCERAVQHRQVLREVELRTQAEQRLKHIAFHDELTGLPNRLFLISKIEEANRAAVDGGWEGALIYIDIDNFRDINDSLGHATGDQLLQLVAERLRLKLAPGEVAARLGGDEFAILIPRLPAGREALQGIVEAMRESLKRPFYTEARPLYVMASFGLAVFPGGEREALAILRQGDLAMSRVKSRGRDGMQLYEPEMKQEARKRFRLDTDMREALAHDQFELYVQPQVHDNGCILGAECLIRWPHPEFGFVSPFDFISIAEKTGFIVPIGEWVLNEACRHIVALRDYPASRQWRLAVNISAKQFHQPNFVEKVESILEANSVSGSSLELELTESTLLDNVDQAIEKMAQLQSMGIDISIDDFGTGYSSLMYLKRLPINKVKIDQSFVRDIHRSPDDATIVEAIMAMAARFGLSVIAEGVEAEEELRFLSNLGCKEFQGYYFHKPMTLQHLKDIATLGGL